MSDNLQAVARQTDVRIVVLTVAGDRFFCPGADLDASCCDLNELAPPIPDRRDPEVADLLHEMPAETIAAINGSCAGAGLAWTAVTKLRNASSDALRSMKSNFVGTERLWFGDFVALESERFAALVTGPSLQEGIARFLDRREH